jgi:hypothetical protein
MLLAVLSLEEGKVIRARGHARLAGRVAQVIEHLPSKCKAQNSNPSIAKNKN